MYSVKRGNRFLLLTLIFYIMGSTLITLYMGFTQKSISMVTLTLLSQWIIIFIPIVLYFVITRVPIKETLLVKKISWLNVLYCVLLAWCILPFLELLNALSQFFVKNEIQDIVLQLMSKPLWLVLLLIAVTPAIIEEIAMRSIIISNYRNMKVLTTCLISGFFFGMFHMNINQFIYAFFMGAIMAFVVHVTGSIFASMIIHFTVNATNLIWAKIALYMQDFAVKMNPDYANQINQTVTTSTLLLVSVGLLVVCAAFAPLVILLLKALMKKNNKENILKDGLTTAEALGLDNNTETALNHELQLSNRQIANEKIVTASFIINIAIFLSFAVGIQIVLPLFLPATT